MIVASVLPYYRAEGGARCVVVITDTALPPAARVLAEEEIPVGHLATVDGKVTRVVGPPEIAAVVARVVALVREHAVGLAQIESPPGDGVEAVRGRMVGQALLEAMPCVAALTLGIVGDLAARLAVVLPRMEDEGRQAAVDLTPSLAPPVPPVAPANATARHKAEPTPAPPPAQPPPKAGRRVAGIDPGSRHVAVTVLEALGVEGVGGVAEVPVCASPVGAIVAGLWSSNAVLERRDGTEPQNERAQVVHAPHSTTLARVVASLRLTLGRDVPLRTPKVITRKDGSTYIKTHRHEVTDADVVQLLTDVALFLAPLEVDEVRVETATHAHEGPDGPRRGATAFLLRSNRYGGVIEGALLAKGLPVKTTTSRTWRAVVKKMAGAMVPGKGADDARTERDHAEPGGLRGSTARSGAVREGPRTVPIAGGVGEGASAVSAKGPEGSGHAVGGEVQRGMGEGRGVAPLTWRSAVRALVTDLPDGEHILDAAGCALPAFAPTPEEKPAPTPRGTRKASGGSRRARQDEERAAMGCLGDVCRARGKRGHDPACPVAVARAAKASDNRRGGVQKCRKCGQPRKGHVCPAKEGASG